MRIVYFVPTPFLQAFVASEIKAVQEAGHDVVIVPLHSSPLAAWRNIWEEMPSIKTLPASLFDLDVIYLTTNGCAATRTSFLSADSSSRNGNTACPRASRVERLSAHATEIGTRLQLTNNFLFKVDSASMKERLEIRVPMLDEELFAFGLSLPHELKVRSQKGKRVLRALAERWLPQAVARKPKAGFAIPVDTWVDADFKIRLKEVLLGPSSRLPGFFDPKSYRPIIERFCEGRSDPAKDSRKGLYQRAIMLLSVHVSMEQNGSCAA